MEKIHKSKGFTFDWWGIHQPPTPPLLAPLAPLVDDPVADEGWLQSKWVLLGAISSKNSRNIMKEFLEEILGFLSSKKFWELEEGEEEALLLKG